MNNRMVEVIVSGADGQVGQEFQFLSKSDNNFSFNFFSKKDLDISSPNQLEKYITQIAPKFFINCAAYTQVDSSEEEQDKAYSINAEAVKHLGKICAKHHTVLIHISSDYVYHNDIQRPLKETDSTNPKGVYAKSKLKGEEYIREFCPEHIIVRSSWIYSSFGHNFLKTMLKLFKSKDEISVVNDQIGSPTYARDLATLIVRILQKLSTPAEKQDVFGTFNYSNEGSTNWFDFAREIRENSGLECKINPTTTAKFNALAVRPAYSVLDKTKIKQAFSLEDIPHWKDSLGRCMSELNN